MLRKVIAAVMIVVLITIMIGCSAHIHTVGKGAQKGQVVEARQWYALWGLVPINAVDSASMAGGATDYEIKTEGSALDIIMNIFTSYITVVSRTVTVTK